MNTSFHLHADIQQEAKQFFLNSFQSRKMHSSLLIAGPQGIGKALLAFQFSKFLLQHPLYKPQDLNDIGIKSVANKVDAGTHPDMIVIDAQIHNGERRKQPTITVDEVRDVNAFLRLTPAESDYRVVIINGANHMTVSASNALLKILEEPPENAVIFLITDSQFTILPTIRSRCVLLRLHKLSFDEFKHCMHLKMKGSEITNGSLEELYEVTDGNLMLSSLICDLYRPSMLREMAKALDSHSIQSVVHWIDSFKPNNENWPIVRNVLLKRAINQVREAVSSSSVDLAQKLDYYFKLQKKLAQEEGLHLDKQHLILSIME